jgi:hypothetical protein
MRADARPACSRLFFAHAADFFGVITESSDASGVITLGSTAVG